MRTGDTQFPKKEVQTIFGTLITEAILIYSSGINCTTSWNFPFNLIKMEIFMCSINDNWWKYMPNYLNQHLYCELVNIFGVTSITSPVNIYNRHYSLLFFPIAPKYYPMSLMKIEKQVLFVSLLFHMIQVPLI